MRRGKNKKDKPKRRRRSTKNAPKKARPRRSRRKGRPPLGTEDWTPTFLQSLAVGNHITQAAKDAKINPCTARRRRAEDPAFAAQWKEARTIGKEELEAEANRRAYHGTDRPIFHAGVVVGHVKEYSDRLLMFLMRAEDPEKFAKMTKTQLTGKDGKPLEMVLVDLTSDEFKNLPPAERIQRLRESIEAKRQAAAKLNGAK